MKKKLSAAVPFIVVSLSLSLSLPPFFPTLTHSIAGHDIHHPAPRQIPARLGDVLLQPRAGLRDVPERRDAQEQGEEGVEAEAEEGERGELFFFFFPIRFFCRKGVCVREGGREQELAGRREKERVPKRERVREVANDDGRRSKKKPFDRGFESGAIDNRLASLLLSFSAPLRFSPAPRRSCCVPGDPAGTARLRRPRPARRSRPRA